MHDVIVQNERGEVRFNLGESGWLGRYRKYLEQGRITIINEQGSTFSVDTAGHRWVLFYRTYGRMRGKTGSVVRLLCVGWQDTMGGKNVKSLVWVYPNGTIEMAEEPAFWDRFEK